MTSLKIFSEKLNLISSLFAASHIKKYLSFYLVNDLISKEFSLNFNEEYCSLIKKGNYFSEEIIEGFGVPKNLVVAPIANDYTKYYESDKTDGEFSLQKDNISKIANINSLRPKF
jgi:hypothetical protein